VSAAHSPQLIDVEALGGGAQGFATMSYREALRLAMREEMLRDERVFVMGEEVGVFEGAYKVTAGLLAEFGPDRVRGRGALPARDPHAQRRRQPADGAALAVLRGLARIHPRPEGPRPGIAGGRQGAAEGRDPR
jgi:hypothetical protein